jgi:hypothetical protein
MEERMKRMEEEFKRLELRQNKDKERRGVIEDEVERYRSQRVDDAMLIDKLRSQ